MASPMLPKQPSKRHTVVSDEGQPIAKVIYPLSGVLTGVYAKLPPISARIDNRIAWFRRDRVACSQYISLFRIFPANGIKRTVLLALSHIGPINAPKHRLEPGVVYALEPLVTPWIRFAVVGCAWRPRGAATSVLPVTASRTRFLLARSCLPRCVPRCSRILGGLVFRSLGSFWNANGGADA